MTGTQARPLASRARAGALLLGAILALSACDPATLPQGLPEVAFGETGPAPLPPGPEQQTRFAGTVAVPVETVGGQPVPVVAPGAVSIVSVAPAEAVLPAGVPVRLQLEVARADRGTVTVIAAIVMRAGGRQEGEVYRTLRVDRPTVRAEVAGPTPRGVGTRTVQVRLIDPRSHQEVARAAPVSVTIGAGS